MESSHRISVVSDAGWSLFGGGRSVPVLGAAQELADYDLALLKPALLYGDRVTLYSGNAFVAAQAEHLAARSTMPPQALGILLNLWRYDPSMLAVAGILPTDFPDENEAAGFLARSMDANEYLTRGFENWGSQIDEVMGKLERALLDSLPEYFSDELQAGIDAGILEIRGHAQEAPLAHNLIFGKAKYMVEDPTNYQLRAAVELALQISDTQDSVLLDAWAYQLLVSESPLRVQSQADRLGTQIIAGMPAVRNASVRELLDIREELANPLVRFRAAVTRASRDSLTSNGPIEEVARVLWDEEVSPALLELEELVQQNSFLRNVIDVVRNPADLVPSAVSLALGVGSNHSLLGAAAGALGLAWPALRALLEQQTASKAIEKHRFFFLHRLQGMGH